MAKSIRCIATVNAASYSGTGTISTSSNSLGYTQGTALNTTSSVNFLSSSTEIAGLLTLTNGLTVTSGTTSVQGLTVNGALTLSGSLGATTFSGWVTCNAGLTVSGSTTTLSTTNIGGLLTCSAGLTVSGSTTTLSTTNIGGLLTCSAGLTVSGSTTTLSTTNIGGLLTCSAGLTVSSGTTTIGALTASSTSASPYSMTVTSTSDNRLVISCVNAGTAGTPGISLRRGTSATERNVIFVNSSNNFAIYSNTIAADTLSINNTTGAITVPYNLTVSGTTTCGTGGSAMSVNSSGVLTVANTTVSSSITTGCATFAGGIGVAGITVRDFTVTAAGTGYFLNTQESTDFVTGCAQFYGGINVRKNVVANRLYTTQWKCSTYTNSTDSNQQYSISNIKGLGPFGIYKRTSLTTTRVDSLPTAASIVSTMDYLEVGSVISFIVENSSGFAITLAVPIGCGYTNMLNSGSSGTINSGSSRQVFIYMLNVSSGTESYQAYF